MPDDVTALEMMYMLRGGWSDTCDFCATKVGEENIQPEEAGMWVCLSCMARWENERESN